MIILYGGLSTDFSRKNLRKFSHFSENSVEK